MTTQQRFIVMTDINTLQRLWQEEERRLDAPIARASVAGSGL